jgi:prophage regulatory protein
MSNTNPAAQPAPTLPTIGMSRFKKIQPFLPISRERFRQLVRDHKAPQPTYLGSRCAMYKNSELHKFLADPLNHRAEVTA